MFQALLECENVSHASGLSLKMSRCQSINQSHLHLFCFPSDVRFGKGGLARARRVD